MQRTSPLKLLSVRAEGVCQQPIRKGILSRGNSMYKDLEM